MGKILSEATKQKQSKSHLKRWANKIKIGKIYLHQNNNRIYKKWRMDVFTRDNFTCQVCNQKGIYLEAHHIKSWTKYPNLRYSIENGITLCKECHKLTRSHKNGL